MSSCKVKYKTLRFQKALQRFQKQSAHDVWTIYNDLRPRQTWRFLRNTNFFHYGHDNQNAFWWNTSKTYYHLHCTLHLKSEFVIFKGILPASHDPASLWFEEQDRTSLCFWGTRVYCVTAVSTVTPCTCAVNVPTACVSRMWHHMKSLDMISSAYLYILQNNEVFQILKFPRHTCSCKSHTCCYTWHSNLSICSCWNREMADMMWHRYMMDRCSHWWCKVFLHCICRNCKHL